MNKKKSSFLTLFPLISLFTLFSCQDFLEKKPQMDIATPETLEDVRAMLDNDDILNRTGLALMEIGSDDFYLSETELYNVSETYRGMYLWAKDYEAVDIGDWFYAYQAIMLTNVALESLERISGNEKQKHQLRGEALFVRAFQHYNLAQVFAPPYQTQGENSGEGIPIKLTSDFEEVISRQSVKAVYEQIEKDLDEALPLLPPLPQIKTRPSQAAVYAFKARMFLMMAKYEEAFDMADRCLKLYDALLDLNEIDLDNMSPFPLLHEEIIYAGYSGFGDILAQPYANIDNELFESYQENDMRKQAYFYEKSENKIGFKSNYIGVFSTFFSGLATDEIFLIRAEASIRKGEVKRGLQDINHLLSFKYSTNTFESYENLSIEEAMDLVLKERRKELLFRGLRWSDLKRLNQEEGRQQTIFRYADDGETVLASLPPNDPRYTFLIPDNVIYLSNINQNVR